MKNYIRTYNRQNRKRTLATARRRARHEELAESRSRSKVVVTPKGKLQGFGI